MQQPYRQDLAFIHDDGFGAIAAGAARVLLETLQHAGLTHGTVVDLGCGSGLLARPVCDAGYDVVGFDVSEAFVALARARVPEATFRVASFVASPLPPCVAIAAVGEVLSYTFDEGNDAQARAALFRRAYEALTAGGVFLFDVAGPDRAPPSPQRSFSEGPGWTVLVEAKADGPLLTRRITTFRRVGGLYRRDEEVHRQHLIAPADVEAALRSTGFSVRTMPAYHDVPLPHGDVAFLARKPAVG